MSKETQIEELIEYNEEKLAKLKVQGVKIHLLIVTSGSYFC